MSQFKSKQLLADLQIDIIEITEWAKQLLIATHYLNTIPQPGKWTIAQVIEHLNTYNDYYLPEIAKALQHYPTGSCHANGIFKTGLIGGYLTKMMQPDINGNISSKTKAFKKHIPVAELNAKTVLQGFVAGQEQFLLLIRQAHLYDLNKVRIKMSISNLIKLKLGDVLRVLVIHQQRHFIQIREAQGLIIAKQKLQIC
ncbi:DinB family protein [Mucilaginibacter sp. PAMB04168]|uniref:DinB family protein n=1 Tax=Mucilaginibacter sp. PAMB04168 TaxID=3138567 RepID=UPI0031F6330C